MSPTTAKTPLSALGDLLLRNSPGCTWLLRRNGWFHTVYGQAEPVFSRTAAALENSNFAEWLTPAARIGWDARLEKIFQGSVVAAPMQLAGSPQPCCVVLFPVRDAPGEILYAGGRAQPAPETGWLLGALDAAEAERERLSRLLHDRIAQGLSSVGLQLDLLRMDLADSASPGATRACEIQETLDGLLELVRDLSRQMQAELTERVGLRAALDHLAGRLRSEFRGHVRLLVDGMAQAQPAAAAALYRIAERAASFAARRQGCSAIEILLKSLPSGPALEICGNGTAFDLTEAGCQNAGLELAFMQHFALQAEIQLEIEQSADRGTLVRAMCAPG